MHIFFLIIKEVKHPKENRLIECAKCLVEI